MNVGITGLENFKPVKNKGDGGHHQGHQGYRKIVIQMNNSRESQTYKLYYFIILNLFYV